jgi:hypothetical protein
MRLTLRIPAKASAPGKKSGQRQAFGQPLVNANPTSG